MESFHHLAAFILEYFLDDCFGGLYTALTSGKQYSSRYDEWRTRVVAVLTAFQVGMRMVLSTMVWHGSINGGAVAIKHGLEVDRTQTSVSVDFCHGQRAIIVSLAVVCAYLLVDSPLNPTANIHIKSCQYPIACLCAKASDLMTEVGPNPGYHRFDMRGIDHSHDIVSWQRVNRDTRPK